MFSARLAKQGAFVLNENEEISALKALTLAGGLSRVAAPTSARVLRRMPGAAREDWTFPVNLSSIMKNRTSDVPLQAEDILYIPGSLAKKISTRSIEGCFRSRNESRGMAGGRNNQCLKLTCSRAVRLRDMRLFPHCSPMRQIRPRKRTARRIPYFARVFPNLLYRNRTYAQSCVRGPAGRIGTFPYRRFEYSVRSASVEILED